MSVRFGVRERISVYGSVCMCNTCHQPVCCLGLPRRHAVAATDALGGAGEGPACVTEPITSKPRPLQGCVRPRRIHPNMTSLLALNNKIQPFKSPLLRSLDAHVPGPNTPLTPFFFLCRKYLLEKVASPFHIPVRAGLMSYYSHLQVSERLFY